MNTLQLSFGGPEFLAVYTMLATLVLLFCWAYVRWPDRSRRLPRLSILPRELELYEIAYMRSGLSGLAQVITIGLVDRGVLTLNAHSQAGKPSSGGKTKGGWLAQSDSPVEVTALSAMELAVYQWFKTPRDARLCDGAVLSRKISTFGLAYEESLQRKSLLREKSGENLVLLFAGAILALLAVPRIINGLAQGRPVLLLIALLVISISLLGVLYFSNRLSHRGRYYLADLKSAEQSLRASGVNRYTLAVALWGLGALNGTVYAEVGTLLASRENTTSAVGGGCGGGCGGCGG